MLQHISGNAYAFTDDFAQAQLDLLGSEEGFLVVLKSYRVSNPGQEGKENDQAVIAWLAEKLSGHRSFRQFTILHKGAIVFSRRP
jgi:hypothetical protein